MQQLVLDIDMAPEPSFARFAPAGNEAAVQCLQEGVAALLNQNWDEAPATALPSAPLPVYLWGQRGTGKTHLLSAVALALQQHGLPVGWLRAGARPARSRLPDFDPRWHAILLDDVARYSAAEQQRAFNWFINATHPADGLPRWIVAAGNAPPVDLQLRDDLRSRLGSGLSFELHPLDDATRLQVLQRQALERGLQLSDEVAQYLLTRFARDLSSLSELLARLDAHALRTQRAITIPLLREALQAHAARSDGHAA